MMIKKSLTIFTVFFFCCVGMAMAGDRIQDKDQDQKRDGSCLEDAIESAPGLKLATDGTKDQDRKRDGSCLEDAIDSAPGLKLAADRMRDKDQDHKRDGSCLL